MIDTKKAESWWQTILGCLLLALLFYLALIFS